MNERLLYNSVEALQGDWSQSSDAYSLGLTMYSIFKSSDPFTHMTISPDKRKPTSEFAKDLIQIISKGLGPKLSSCPLFRSLKTIEDGKYKSIYFCLCEVFEGLTKLNIDERMSVHEAWKKVQPLKSILPKIGEGWNPLPIHSVRLEKDDSNPGSIFKVLKPFQKYSTETQEDIGKRRFNPESPPHSEEHSGLEEELPLKKISVASCDSLSICDLDSLQKAILKTSSDSEVSILFEQKFSMISNLFEKYKTPQEIETRQDLFLELFKCLYLFSRHDSNDNQSIFLESSSLEKMINSFLSSMIKVESCLRIIEEVEIEEEEEVQSLKSSDPDYESEEESEEESGEGSEEGSEDIFENIDNVSHILFRIVSIAESKVKSLYQKLVPKIYPIVERIFADYLDDIITFVKRKKAIWVIKYWAMLISTLSLVPSLVPKLSPRYDEDMRWCKENGGWKESFIQFEKNCQSLAQPPKRVSLISPSSSSQLSPLIDPNPEIDDIDLGRLIDTIKNAIDSDSKIDIMETSRLYHQHRNAILSVFLASQSKNKIEENIMDISICFNSLMWLITHKFSKNNTLFRFSNFHDPKSVGNFQLGNIYLPISDLIDIFETFIGYFSTVEEVLQGAVDEEYCVICLSYTSKIKDKYDSVLSKIAPTFQGILERGSKKKIDGDVPLYMLHTLSNISNSKSSTRSSIFTLIKPYIKDWMRIYGDNINEVLIIILSKLTWSPELHAPVEPICSELWPLFHPIVEIIKGKIIGRAILEGDYRFVLLLFANFCCDPSHAIEVHNNINHLLEGWFEAFRKKKHKWGIRYWSNFISILSTVPSLVFQISPKYDSAMAWCKDNGALRSYYTRYHQNGQISKMIDDNLFIQKQWMDLIDLIKKCSDSESTSKMYREQRESILSLFLSDQSRGEIEYHRKEIILCCQCLRWFVKHSISGTKIFLPISDLNDLIDTFITHLSRVEEVLERDVDEEYCAICVDYLFKVRDEYENDLPKIIMILDSLFLKISDFLDGWFESVKKKKYNWGIKFWSNLISMLSTVPSLVPHLYPKYNEEMIWCKDNGGLRSDYSKYHNNCHPHVQKLEELISLIKKCPDSESISVLYHEYREYILSLFHSYQSRSDIKEHNSELVLCCKCLMWFVRHKISGLKVFLSISCLHDLIDTFLEHMSRVEEVLEIDVDEEYCTICVFNTFINQYSMDKNDSFLPKIAPTFQRILERGCKQKLEGESAKCLLISLRNISSSEVYSTRSSIFSLLKPYFKDWLTVYHDSQYYESWFVILTNISWLAEDKSPNKTICSEIWAFSEPIFNMVKKYYIKETMLMGSNVLIIRLFSNLCCDLSHTIEAFNNINHLLEGWFEVIKDKTHKWGIKYWVELISIFSTVPSLVPRISPKFDAAMEWCKDNEKVNDNYTKYRKNCDHYPKSMGKLLRLILKSRDSDSISKLYQENRELLLSVFLAYQSKSEIEEHKTEFVSCCECLDLIVMHMSSGNEIYLPISDLNDMIDTFIVHLSHVEEVLESSIDEKYCNICIAYTFQVDELGLFLPKIVPTLQRILERGCKEKLQGDLPKRFLMTLKNLSISQSSSTLSSIFTLIKPYIRDWLKLYQKIIYYEEWISILSDLTWSLEDDSPNKIICSESWLFFHPILDVVKRSIVGDKIIEQKYIRVLKFFSNLCSDPSHVREIYNNIEDLLDEWFEVIKRKNDDRGIQYWSELISMLSSNPSLIDCLISKFTSKMEWCKENGGRSDDYSKYIMNCFYPHLKKLENLISSIKNTPYSESTSKLYHEHKKYIVSVFRKYQSRRKIRENKKEIVLCCKCLALFAKHVISDPSIYLPIPDFTDLIYTFIDYLSKVSTILKEDVDDEYCCICVYFSFKVNELDSFFPRISPALQRLLERGSKRELEGNIPKYVLIALKNISISGSSSTRSSIFALIKPYLEAWLRIYRDVEYFEKWIIILAKLTQLSGEKSPNQTICSEIWPFFFPILAIVKKECVGDGILKGTCFHVLDFFSNLCCNFLHAREVYENIKYLLDGWFNAFKKEKHNRGMRFWSTLISIFSSIPSLVPHLSPKYDDNMSWCKDNGGLYPDFMKYAV
ncbi:hypothetical protein ADUPG1_007752, partial [Aduncisulcus paluster]